MITTISGNRLIDFIENNSIESVVKDITFKNIIPKALFIKLEKANGKRLYSFTKSYHKKLYNLKVPLEFNKEYYIYEEDIDKFNKMETLTQLKYLNDLWYDGLCLGDCDTEVLQTYLLNKIVLNTPYTFTFTKSNETNSYWLYTESNMNNGEAIAIWTKPILKYCAKMFLEVDYVIKEKKPTFYKQTTELFESFNNSKNLKVKFTDCSMKKDGYYLRINVYGRCNEDNSLGYIFALIFTQNGIKQLAKIFIASKVLDECDSNYKADDAWLVSYNEVIKVLNKIIEIFDNNERFKEIGNELATLIS